MAEFVDSPMGIIRMKPVRKLTIKELEARRHTRDMVLNNLHKAQALYDRICKELETGYAEV